MRANKESCLLDARMQAASAAAQASAAKPEADEAMPAAVGKLFSEDTRARVLMPASFLTASSTRETRTVSSLRAVMPFSEKMSRESAVSNSTVVRVLTVSSMVTLTLPLKGRLSAESRLPQYFTTAMFGVASQVDLLMRRFASRALLFVSTRPSLPWCRRGFPAPY